MSRDYKALLNDKQLEAVTTTDGPLLVLAGAGSGKTRALTYRISYLIEEKGVAPWNIMAITFTNKAAGEMRDRIRGLIGDDADKIWAMTFHSSAVRILRRFGDRIGYDSNFSIYDTDDSKTVMKNVLKDLNIDTKRYKEKTFLNVISHAKDELKDPEKFESEAQKDNPFDMLKCHVYKAYQNRLKANNAMDFDDIIVNTVKVLKEDAEALQYYEGKFQYVMVDEYQDTNTAQFEMVRLLSSGSRNLCVVGDDDQSIYKFRGANIYNILNFEKYFPDAKTIRLEQNYRSTSIILDAANSVIKNNKGRKVKKLWTENEKGDKVRFRTFDSGFEEAEFIASDIAKEMRNGAAYSDFAVLYRTNAQSRLLEEQFIKRNMPYKIVGGVNFYSRKEVKDILAYLKTIANGLDDLAVRRIINVPKRGIGATSIDKVQIFADANGMSFYEALKKTGENPSLKSASKKMLSFVSFIEEMREFAEKNPVPEVIKKVYEETGYKGELEAENTDESKTRMENIDELFSKAVTYQNDSDNPTLAAFLEEVALVADIDNLPEDESFILLMTLHGAKGLEFENVYIAGMEDGLFPSEMSITADDSNEEIEEERRLAYVGITRAKKHLTLTAARQRMIRGETKFSKMSRFVKEIDPDLIDGSLYEEKGYSDYDGNFNASYGYSKSHRPYDFGDNSGRSDGASSGSYSTGRTGSHSKFISSSNYSEQNFQKTYAPKKNFGSKIEKQPLSYKVGDRVSHQKFGVGTVTEIVDGGRDFEVTVNFDTAGVKRMFASFAKMQKV